MKMDLCGEAILILRGSGPLPPCQDTEAGVMHVSEDPRLLRARAIPATECSRKAAPSFWSAAACCRFCVSSLLETLREASFRPRKAAAGYRAPKKKDVKLDGTNSISPVESTKVSRNELKTNAKRSGKTCCEYAKEPEQTYERVGLPRNGRSS